MKLFVCLVVYYYYYYYLGLPVRPALFVWPLLVWIANYTGLWALRLYTWHSSRVEPYVEPPRDLIWL